jgi:hypothetical protein
VSKNELLYSKKKDCRFLDDRCLDTARHAQKHTWGEGGRGITIEEENTTPNAKMLRKKGEKEGPRGVCHICFAPVSRIDRARQGRNKRGPLGQLQQQPRTDRVSDPVCPGRALPMPEGEA